MLPLRPSRLPLRLKTDAVAIDQLARCAARSFSSSQSNSALHPEMPNFIDIPEPLQPVREPAPRVRGYLPTPRRIFKAGLDKSSDKFIARTAAPPSQPYNLSGSKEVQTRRQWAQEMAEIRRQSLGSSLKAIRAREKTEKKRDFKKGLERWETKQALATAPVPEDELLTAVSQPLAHPSYFQHGPLPIGDRATRLEQGRANVAKRLTQKAADRKKALIELYRNVISHDEEFITDEARMNEVIDRVFSVAPAEFKSLSAANIWYTGVPMNIEAEITELVRREKKASVLAARNLDDGGGPVNIERMKKISETLLGKPLRSTEKDR